MKKTLNENAYLFVNFYDDWEGQIYLHGAKVFTKGEWDTFKERAKILLSHQSFVWYLGSDQSTIYKKYEAFMEHFGCKVITAAQFKFLNKVMPHIREGFGHFPDPTDEYNALMDYLENHEQENQTAEEATL